MKEILRKNRTIVNNFFSLSILNVVNFLTPLITLPYLIEVLGAEGYGRYAFVYTILVYNLMVVNFGFNFSATKEVAIQSGDIHRLSKIFTEVMVVRFLLAVSCVTVSVLILINIPKFYDTAILVLIGSGIVFGTILVPNFLYQGLEKMKYITIGAVVPKIVMISLIFVLVTEKGDIGFLMLIQSLGFLISGLIGTIISFKIIKVRVVKFGIKDLRRRIKDSYYLFLSTIGMSLYRESGTLILGLFSSFEMVGFYSAAEKIVRAIQAALNPIAQSIFPHFANRFNKEDDLQKKRALSSFGKFIKYYAYILFMISGGVFFLVPWIVRFFSGSKYNNSILDIRLLTPLVFFGCLNFVIGIVGLVNLGQDKYFTKGVLLAGLCTVIFSSISVHFLNDIGVAISVSLAEMILFVFLFKKFRLY